MRRRVFLLVTGFIAGAILMPSVLSGQTVKDDVIKVQLRHPQRPSNRYLDNNKPKKKLRVRIRTTRSWNCPCYQPYISRPEKAREKLLKKRRKKI